MILKNISDECANLRRGISVSMLLSLEESLRMAKEPELTDVQKKEVKNAISEAIRAFAIIASRHDDPVLFVRIAGRSSSFCDPL